MDKIKVLEEIGLKKVSQETHIEEKYIKYMIDCDFDKLNRINTLGFVKILSREYQLDLSTWNEAFEEYWQENRHEEDNDGLFIVVDDNKKSKKFLVFLLILLVGSILSILFSIFQDKIDFVNYMNNGTSSYEQASIVQETQESLDMVKNNDQEDNATIAQINADETLDETVDTVVQEDVEKEEIIQTVDKNDTVDTEKKIPINETITKTEVYEKNSPRFKDEAIIIPHNKLWVGIIYLDDKKRRSYLGEGNFSIDISREQIITTGHGSFDLSAKDGIKKFNKQAPMRFLVKDANITEISWRRFRELNEGKAW
ncbi:hypothetical protein [Sulfurospirillum arcachonense]|uniref:hypothetical protein n=1 Tax=Sulfurospirillum arcachonense TaxID=57666 RepID=UPI000467FE6C|nr:hypothetical protein [Sulfurospirillum arcachonense]